jgi:predicted MFS family arabinose efflux permease
MVSGIGLAFLVMSPIIETLLTHVGWRYTYRAISGMALLVCICGLSFSPHVEKDIAPQTRRGTIVIQDKVKRTSLLRNGRFVICCLSTGVVFHLGFTIPIVHMVSDIQVLSRSS